ncbi:hypothetical protein KP806_07730 [Paenibacillus sp. N4]|uniref:capsular polysaccharide export protein, LipB/KpsS family n=1 Tax=Paenibacillus vietnamensis TaxID=2590547 RepID=UPI001CD0B577|nr:hypothetical protein [Paenibacillus vietnamensis]MCA0754937.1 hypothetical protein [Paenibacillus vietnamensis]
MHNKTWMIWRHSISFLEAFKSLRYDDVPLGIVMLRDFQKYVLHHSGAFGGAKRSGRIRNIQAACKPYLVPSKPNLRKSGYTVVRAELFGMTKGVTGEKILYVAHYSGEYRTMLKRKECRPLVYLHGLPPAKLPPAMAQKTMSQLRAALSSAPAVFRRPAFRSWLTARVKKAMLHIRRVHTLFNRYPIRRTIYGSTINHHGALMTSFAQSRNVHTVMVQHGLMAPIAHFPVNADLNFVWGKSHANFLQSYGAPAGKIVVSGPCFYRNLPTGRSASSVMANAPIKLLVALQPLGLSHNRGIIRSIEQAVKPFGGKISVTYKAHPDQGGCGSYRKWLRCKKSKILRHGIVPLNKLIEQADAVITPYSSVSYEALINGKPVIYYGTPKFIYYIRNTPVSFRSAAGLKKILAKAVANRGYFPALHARLGVIDKVKPSMDGYRFIWTRLRRLAVTTTANEMYDFEPELKREPAVETIDYHPGLQSGPETESELRLDAAPDYETQPGYPNANSTPETPA